MRLGFQARRLLANFHVPRDQRDQILLRYEPHEPHAATSPVSREDGGSSSLSYGDDDNLLPCDYQPSVKNNLDNCTIFHARGQAGRREHTQQLPQCSLTSTATAVASSRPDSTASDMDCCLKGPHPCHMAQCYSSLVSKLRTHPLSSLWESQRTLRDLALHLQDAGLKNNSRGAHACATPGPLDSLGPPFPTGNLRCNHDVGGNCLANPWLRCCATAAVEAPLKTCSSPFPQPLNLKHRFHLSLHMHIRKHARCLMANGKGKRDAPKASSLKAVHQRPQGGSE